MKQERIPKEEKEAYIDELLSRSVAAVFPSKEELKKLLLSGKRLKIYIGADATGPDLHVGHATNYLLLEKFRRLGHKVIVLFGDFTAMIGDPTGKESARKALTSAEVKKNIATWKKQLSPLLPFSGFSNKANIVKNSSWLSKLTFADVVSLSSHFTVQQMIERDMFDKRIKAGSPVYLNEFLYPLMQGYDSVALDVDVEIGGNDQTFNMLAGRTLQKKINNKEKFVIATTLLVNQKTGKKIMNKSEGGVVGLKDEPKEMFGKIMALPDEVVPQMFYDCTLLSSEEIKKNLDILFSGGNPRDTKALLAEEIVKIYHGAENAKKAKDTFFSTFSKGDTPEDSFEEFSGEGEPLSEILLRENKIKSKGEWGRLVQGGGVFSLTQNEKVGDLFYKVQKGEKFRVGKKTFIKIK